MGKLGIFPYINFSHLIVFQSFNCFHLKKSLHSKRRELNKVIYVLSYIVLLRCRLIHSQHYATYEHIYIYMCIIYIIYTNMYIYIHSSFYERIQRRQSAHYRRRRAIAVKVTLTSDNVRK